MPRNKKWELRASNTHFSPLRKTQKFDDYSLYTPSISYWGKLHHIHQRQGHMVEPSGKRRSSGGIRPKFQGGGGTASDSLHPLAAPHITDTVCMTFPTIQA